MTAYLSFSTVLCDDGAIIFYRMCFLSTWVINPNFVTNSWFKIFTRNVQFEHLAFFISVKALISNLVDLGDPVRAELLDRSLQFLTNIK
jgi:hypothetical protein